MTITVSNTMIAQVERKMPNVSGLVTTTVLNTKVREVENKTSSAIDLVRKTNNAKISDVEAKSFTTFDHSKITGKIFDAKVSNS